MTPLDTSGRDKCLRCDEYLERCCCVPPLVHARRRSDLPRELPKWIQDLRRQWAEEEHQWSREDGTTWGVRSCVSRQRTGELVTAYTKKYLRLLHHDDPPVLTMDPAVVRSIADDPEALQRIIDRAPTHQDHLDELERQYYARLLESPDGEASTDPHPEG
jgi:hypothetical protein